MKSILTDRWALYEQLKREARKKVGGQHRAALDVRYLIELYRFCDSEVNKNGL
jgi:hypothetical protein